MPPRTFTHLSEKTVFSSEALLELSISTLITHSESFYSLTVHDTTGPFVPNHSQGVPFVWVYVHAFMHVHSACAEVNSDSREIIVVPLSKYHRENMINRKGKHILSLSSNTNPLFPTFLLRSL